MQCTCVVPRDSLLDTLKAYIVLLIAFILFFITILSAHQTQYVNNDNSSVKTQYIGISTGSK
nr:MAG: hypothetical protein 3 [Tombusviridae sp.]UHS72354.1 MAG: hypothetical protein 3 [Tombusviridae sp.]